MPVQYSFRVVENTWTKIGFNHYQNPKTLSEIWITPQGHCYAFKNNKGNIWDYGSNNCLIHYQEEQTGYEEWYYDNGFRVMTITEDDE